MPRDEKLTDPIADNQKKILPKQNQNIIRLLNNIYSTC